jgi:hypothetical protein
VDQGEGNKTMLRCTCDEFVGKCHCTHRSLNIRNKRYQHPLNQLNPPLITDLSNEGQISLSPRTGDNLRSFLLELCPEMQITILKYLLQPPNPSETLGRKDFPFSKSIIPYVVPYSPFRVSREGILRVNHYFRIMGLGILFQDKAYAPVCLCVRWFDRLRFLDLYAHVGYLACSYKRQILLSPSEPTLELPFLGISNWTRLVLPMKMFSFRTASELRTLSRLLAKMTALKSLHLILILSPDQNGSDWEVLFRELHLLEFLDCVSFTVHCVFPWLQVKVSTLATTSGRVYVPVIESNTVRFEGVNLSKEEGLRDLKSILSHTYEVHRRISSVRNGLPSRRVLQVENLATE